MKVTKSCPALSNPMDSGLPGSSVRGISQARALINSTNRAQAYLSSSPLPCQPGSFPGLFSFWETRSRQPDTEQEKNSHIPQVSLLVIQAFHSSPSDSDWPELHHLPSPKPITGQESRTIMIGLDNHCICKLKLRKSTKWVPTPVLKLKFELKRSYKYSHLFTRVLSRDVRWISYCD